MPSHRLYLAFNTAPSLKNRRLKKLACLAASGYVLTRKGSASGFPDTPTRSIEE